MSIKIKNNNMEMHSPNSVNISICNNGINNDDELKIDTKIDVTFNHKAMVELMHFADCVRKMIRTKTIKKLNIAYNIAKCYYIALLKKHMTTGEFEKIYNKNKSRINKNNYSFLKKIIKLFSKGE